jgi:UDP-glucose 4-epimerase
MKSVVTGGAGFIGSHVVDRLIELGHKVEVIDDLSATCHEQFYYNNKANYSILSINDSRTRDLYKDADYVFHLAAEARIQPSFKNPDLTLETNINGTTTVLKYANQAGVKRVIFSSTSSSYGLINDIPLKEDMPTDCNTPYSVTKVAAESFCKIYSRIYGLDTVSLRYFNVYGERQPTKGQYAPIIGLFQRQVNEGNPLTIVGDGEQTRDFTHVSDVVEANILAMQSDQKLSGQIFNIGTGKNYTINELARIIGGKFAFCKQLPERKGEARNTQADNSKAKDVLGWSPKVKLEDWIGGYK